MSPSEDRADFVAAEEQRLRQVALLAAYRDLFKLPEGRLVLADLLREGGLLACSHAPGDSHETAFAEGKRALALHLVQQLRWSEAELLQLARQRTTDRLGDTDE
jgi:hypothetical protein